MKEDQGAGKAEAEIRLRSKVMIKSSPGDRVDIYRIVPAAEADADIGRISASAPLGAALLGHAPGETVEFEAHGSRKTVRILKIIPEPND